MLAFFLLLRKEDGGHGQLVHEKLQLVTALQLNTAVVSGCAMVNLVTLAVAWRAGCREEKVGEWVGELQ